MPASTAEHVHTAQSRGYLRGCPGCQALSREANNRYRATTEGRAARNEATRRANRRYRAIPGYTETVSAAARAKRRARTEQQADEDFARLRPGGKPCTGCAEFLPAEAFVRNWIATDGRESRCDRNGCRKRRQRQKQRAKLEVVWLEKGLPTGQCGYCLDAPIEHIDHFVASSKGGADHADNYVGACAPCNLNKSDRDPFEWLAATHPQRVDFFRALFPQEKP